MIFRLKAILALNCLLIVSISYGNQTEWPRWLTKREVVTLLLNSDVPLVGKSSINAIQIEPVSEWAKSGPATLGLIGKDGQFKPKFEVEYSEHGRSAILVDDNFIVGDNLKIKTKHNSRTVGSAEVLESVQETVLKNSRTMPYFDVPRQQFRMSGQFVLLSEPIEIDRVKVSALYFEPYFSTYPGSQVIFGNLDSKGIFTDAPVNTRMWDYRSGGTVLIHLDTGKSKYLRIYRGVDRQSAFITGEGIGSIKLSSLSLVSDKEYFFKKTSISSKMQCSKVLKSTAQ